MITAKMIKQKFVTFGIITAIVISLFDLVKILFKHYTVILSSSHSASILLLFAVINFVVLSILLGFLGFVLGHIIALFGRDAQRISNIKPLRRYSLILKKIVSFKTKHCFLFIILAWLILDSWIITSPLDTSINPSNPLRNITSSSLKKPNIVIILLDTLRSENLLTYGYNKDTMPNLTKFTKGATLFKNTISTSSFTPPSHLSIISGNYVDSQRMEISEQKTLTEMLKQNGYCTVCVTANRLVTTENFVKGFDIYIDNVSAEVLFQYLMSFKIIYKLFHDKIFNLQFMFYHRHTRAEDVNDILFPLLNKHISRNLFLFINYLDPHDPYFPTSKKSEFSPFSLENGFFRHIENWRHPDLDDRQFDTLKNLYDQELGYLDQHLGDLFDLFKELDMLDESIIIVTSDHGEIFGENGYLSHAISLYENEIKVPLIMRGSKIFPEDRQIDKLVQTVDIVPTILDILKMKIPSDIHGQSLMPLLDEEGVGVSRDFVYASQYDFRMIRNSDWKYIRNLKDKSEELFFIKTDPNELNDLKNVNKKKRDELASRLDNFINEYDLGLSSRKSNRRNEELLRSLGYVK